MRATWVVPERLALDIDEHGTRGEVGREAAVVIATTITSVIGSLVTPKSDLRAACAGLEMLLVDASPESPRELLDKVLELAKIVRPAYRLHEWELITATIRDKFGLDVSDVIETDADEYVSEADTFTPLITDGWFKDYLNYTAESEAPAQFHFGAILTCISGAFGRRPLIGWDAAPLFPNIYTLIVGPTGTRKSTALSKARELAVLAFPKVGTGLSRLNVLPNEGSPQGYASALRRRNFEGSPTSDGLIVASELTVLVGREQYKAALGEWLTDWYDNMTPVWSRALKGEETYELVSPYVCFAGASNMTWLREIPDNLIKAGYMPRHLIFTAKEKRRDMANPRFDTGERARLAGELGARVKDLPVAMPLSADAARHMDEWYINRVTRQERLEQDELFAAWLSRKLPHAIKVAVVWQVVDGGPKDELHVDWLQRATRMIDWMDAGVASVYHALGASAEGAVTEAALAYLERKGGKSTMSAMVRGLKNRYQARSIQEGVRTLILGRMITQVQDPTVGTVLTLVDQRRGMKPRG